MGLRPFLLEEEETMALITTLASADANSYCTADEADTYIATREEQFDIASWGGLSAPSKELRLNLAARCMDSMLRFRGVRATRTQAMAFPRIAPGDPLCPRPVHTREMSFGVVRVSPYSTVDGFLPTRNNSGGVSDVTFDTWESLEDYAGLIGAPLPTNPEELKYAQAEIAFQVIHSHLLTVDAFSDGLMAVQSIDLAGALQVNMRFQGSQARVLFDRREFDSLSIVRLYLGRYLASNRMAQP